MGGLGIRDPTLTIITVGAKLVWYIIIGNQGWWKPILLHKYFSSRRHSCILQPLKNRATLKYGEC